MRISTTMREVDSATPRLGENIKHDIMSADLDTVDPEQVRGAVLVRVSPPSGLDRPVDELGSIGVAVVNKKNLPQ